MTLDPPITSEDVERKQLFRTRGGGTARIVRPNGAKEYPWQVYYEQSCQQLGRYTSAVAANGRYYPTHECDFDLISRIPEPAMESQVVDGCCQKHGRTWVTDGACRLCKIHGGLDMKSQVVVEDRRSQKTEPPEWVKYDSLPRDCLFTTKSNPQHIYLKGYDHDCRRIIGGSADALGPHWIVGDDEYCRRLPHLELLMILRDRT